MNAMPPLFTRLARAGLTLTHVEQAVGLEAFGKAAVRCASCPAKAACNRALRWRWLGLPFPSCPNNALFE
jgi:hypothetical protein